MFAASLAAVAGDAAGRARALAGLREESLDDAALRAALIAVRAALNEGSAAVEDADTRFTAPLDPDRTSPELLAWIEALRSHVRREQAR